MTDVVYARAEAATTLCKSCGLCCTGHLFSWVRLKATELTSSKNLGLNVIRNDPRQRGFTQPCPLWNGICTVYNSPHYPKGCNSYKCKLLRELLDESISLPDALLVVENAKAAIRNVEVLLPKSSHSSFRERFVAQVKAMEESMRQGLEHEFKVEADVLLDFIENTFGVKDFFDNRSES